MPAAICGKASGPLSTNIPAGTRRVQRAQIELESPSCALPGASRLSSVDRCGNSHGQLGWRRASLHRFPLFALLFWSLSLGWAMPLSATSVPDLRNTEFMGAVNHIFALVYNPDFDPASAELAKLAVQYPEHPAVPLYQAMVLWLHQLDDNHVLSLDCFFHPACFTSNAANPLNAATSQRIMGLLNASRTLSDRRLKVNPNDADARYYRGAAEALAAAVAITLNRSALDAFRYGQQASAIHHQIFRDNGSYYDAMLLPGLYDYLSSGLPWYLRWLAGGDRERGLNSVNLAAEKGKWVSDDARLIRMMLLLREGRPAEALKDAVFLSEKYPRNYIFLMAQGQALDRMGHDAEADSIYLKILKLAEERSPNYQRIRLSRFRWDVGNRMLAHNPQASLKYYQSILSDSSAEERWKVLAHLQSGCALDLLGRREEAVGQYQMVLRMKEYDNSHAAATRHLKEKFDIIGNRIALPRLSAQ